MATKAKVVKKTVLPSSSEKLDKIINYIMRDGKRSTAKKIYADMLKEIKSN
jgi:ribosomal protein S7